MKKLLIDQAGKHIVNVEANQSAEIYILQIENEEGLIDLTINLNGHHSRAQAYNCFVGHLQNRNFLDVKINHNALSTSANFSARGIMKDHSFGAFNGLITVKKNSQDTNSFLEHRTLMLSNEAEINPIPSLQINANQVRASHAATIHNISEEDLFVLKSRGIPQKEAETILVDSFMSEIVKELPAHWRKKVKETIR